MPVDELHAQQSDRRHRHTIAAARIDHARNGSGEHRSMPVVIAAISFSWSYDPITGHKLAVFNKGFMIRFDTAIDDCHSDLLVMDGLLLHTRPCFLKSYLLPRPLISVRVKY